MYVPFPAIIHFFFLRTPKLGSYPWRYAYPGLGVTGIEGELSGCKAASV